MYWLIIERRENWEADKAAGFRYFGVPNRQRNLASEVQKDDRLITYVSGTAKGFADVRRVLVDGAQRNIAMKTYDSPFPIGFVTEPYIVLPPKKWLLLKSIAKDLELTRDRPDYRPILQTTLRKLSDFDGDYLTNKIKEISKP